MVSKVAKTVKKAVVKVGNKIHKVLAKNEVVRAAVVIAAVAFLQPEILAAFGTVKSAAVLSLGAADGAWVVTYTTASHIAASAAAGAVGGLLGSGGDLKSAAISAVTAAAFAGVHFAPIGGEGSPGRIAAHAVVGGSVEELRGGKFAHGALAGATGQAIGAYGPSGRLGGTITAAVSGGVAAELGGGKFFNGATTAAFGHLFNSCLNSGGDCLKELRDQLQGAGAYKGMPRLSRPHMVNSALAGFKGFKFRSSGNVYSLDKTKMKHILNDHHPAYYRPPTRQKLRETFFNRSLGANEIKQIIRHVMRQNHEILSAPGASNRMYFQIQGNVAGRSYTVGINKGRVGQAYPNE